MLPILLGKNVIRYKDSWKPWKLRNAWKWDHILPLWKEKASGALELSISCAYLVENTGLCASE